MKHIFLLFALLFFQNNSHATCVLYHSQTPTTLTHQDAVSQLLASATSCPHNVQTFLELLKTQPLSLHTAMVANRGKNNPQQGSFSFFSSIHGQLNNGLKINKGDFFIGFFTQLANKRIRLNQDLMKNNLIIELIAFDNDSKLFNFYELRGLDGQNSRWYYRGNSQDAFLDNTLLYRQINPKKPQFGTRMRCSACHNSGGPIIKELAPPHNDWWRTKHPLRFKPNTPTSAVQSLITSLVDATDFATEVQKGMKKLEQSIPVQQFKSTLSLQEQLRPLFCTQEINLESNPIANSKTTTLSPIRIPSGFWISPFLGKIELSLSNQSYQQLLNVNHILFPETFLNDADHAWLTPVKGINDLISIKNLILQQVIDKHFMRSVLMIDFKNPVFSKKRCALLHYVPQHFTPNWQQQLSQNLLTSSQKEAHQLLFYLKAPTQIFLKQIQHYQQTLKKHFSTPESQQKFFLRLMILRESVSQEELSQNPQGQILEPGFRVIFPIANTLQKKS